MPAPRIVSSRPHRLAAGLTCLVALTVVALRAQPPAAPADTSATAAAQSALAAFDAEVARTADLVARIDDAYVRANNRALLHEFRDRAAPLRKKFDATLCDELRFDLSVAHHRIANYLAPAAPAPAPAAPPPALSPTPPPAPSLPPPAPAAHVAAPSLSAPPAAPSPAADFATTRAFLDQHCASCHNADDKAGRLDLEALAFAPADPANVLTWVRVHDRVRDGEMPPKKRTRPAPAALESFLAGLAPALHSADRAAVARDGRSLQRRLNRDEYENALRDLLSAPWLQIKGQLPEDGEAHRFNKSGEVLDVSFVQMARYLSSANYALREAMAAQLVRPPTQTVRYYARDQRSLVKFSGQPPDRLTMPLLGTTAQPDVRRQKAPLTVGAADPATREQEALGMVSSNYSAGFTFRWDQFRAPVAGRYRIRFSGYTIWVGPYGHGRDGAGVPPHRVTFDRPREWFISNHDEVSPGRRDEAVSVYAKSAAAYRRLGSFDLTPEPSIGDIGEVWLQADEAIAPDATRFYRSRPAGRPPLFDFTNPLAQKDGAPGVAFRWMEVEGPLYDEATTAGYRLLFGDLPIRRLEPGRRGVLLDLPKPGPIAFTPRGVVIEPVPERVAVEVVSAAPEADAERLLRGFLARAYRRPVEEPDVQRFLALIRDRLRAGLGFAEAMLAGYGAVLASPGFICLEETAGPLDDYALASRLAFFLWNSPPDDALRARAARGELRRPEVLRAETERLLADPKSRRFIEAFLDYWLDVRKVQDTTPSITLYPDYYLDDALSEAALAETRLFFEELLRADLPARHVVHSDFTYVNERLAAHYGLPGVSGAALRRVALPPDSPRGGFMTQASVLKVTANGTTTSPVLRGHWITERILGRKTPPPPPVPAVEPDIRGAVTIREQLAKHRADPSCASCHSTMDPPGFALENFDIFGGWRDRYRAASPEKPALPGFGKNGHPFTFHLGLPVDASGELPDGRTFRDVRDFKRLLLADAAQETQIARNLVQQLTVFATGAAVRFSDRAAVEQILARAQPGGYGVRSLVHALVQSEIFQTK